MKSRVRIALAGVLALGLTAPACSDTVFVNQAAHGPVRDGSSWQNAFPTVQQGLDAAQPGDEVWAAGGQYAETLVFKRGQVSLYGGFDGTETVRRDQPVTISFITPGDPALPNVTIPLAATGTVFNGFNLVGSGSLNSGILCQATGITVSQCQIHYYSASGIQGGGIFCDTGSSATIRDNVIDDNLARDGGGICALNATVSVLHNYIGNNSAADGTDYTKDAHGGGLAILGGVADIRNNNIESNHARDGGGLWAIGATVTVRYNSVLKNGAEKEATPTTNTPVLSYGGGMALRDCSGAVRDNLVQSNRVYAQAPFSTGNAAFAFGGGIATLIGNVTIANNTVVDNTAIVSGAILYPNYSHSSGGGIYNSAPAVIANNILAMNDATAIPDYGYAQSGSLDTVSTSEVRNNLFFDNAPDTTGNAFTGQDGNLLADPRFAANGYSLSPDSPGIDHGDSAYVASGDTDVAGSARIQGARVDIGAYEFTAPPPPSRVFVSKTGADTSDGMAWASAKRTVQAAILAVGPGGEVWVAAGTYKETVRLYDSVSLYGGFRGAETARDQRNPAARRTILDGEHKGSVLTVPSTVNGATIDGFSIYFGTVSSLQTASGGGIFSAGRNVVIAHNTIGANSVSCVGNGPLAVGGGIAILGGSASILNNVIYNNNVSAYYSGSPVFASVASAYGGGIYVKSAAVIIANNEVSNNGVQVGRATQPSVAGGGVYLEAAGGSIVNNTIVHNTGEGAYIGGPSSGVTLTNNIVALNSMGLRVEAAVPVSHNCFFGNRVADVFGMPDPTGLNGNIKADPMFVVSAAVDFRVQIVSPCRDTGDDAAAIGPTDLNGNPRILLTHVDMGAYEVVTGGRISVGDVATALRIAAGFRSPDSVIFDRLNVDNPGDRRIDLADALRLVRQAAGLDPNP